MAACDTFTRRSRVVAARPSMTEGSEHLALALRQRLETDVIGFYGKEVAALASDPRVHPLHVADVQDVPAIVYIVGRVAGAPASSPVRLDLTQRGEARDAVLQARRHGGDDQPPQGVEAGPGLDGGTVAQLHQQRAAHPPGAVLRQQGTAQNEPVAVAGLAPVNRSVSSLQTGISDFPCAIATKLASRASDASRS